MMFLLMALCLSPTIIFAQQTHRDATEEETKIILSSESESKLRELGIEKNKEVERNILKEALLIQAKANGKLDDVQMKGYIQKLSDQGLGPKEIEAEIEVLSQKYFTDLQLTSLSNVLSNENQKKFQVKFDDLQKRSEKGQLSHEELDKEISLLDYEISKSPLTKENDLKMVRLRDSLLVTARDNTFVKKPNSIDPKQFGKIKIMVPVDFSLSAIENKDPLCLSSAQVPLSLQLDQLNKQFETITKTDEKPLIKQIYFAWGWNRAYHSNTDVKFTTNDGTFTILDAHGKDRPSPFDPKLYFNPTTLTIPQYNVELGVMFNEKWGLELKTDHMKLVFDNTRPYEITGNYNHQVIITNENPTNFWDEQIPVDFSVAQAKKDATWIRFEHSDGYNYASLGAVYNQNLYKTKKEKFKIDSRFGAGAGLMIPKTMVAFHQDQRWNHHGLDNKFHIAGGGVHAEAKIRLTFWNTIFLQAATRGTYIKVKDALVDGSDARMEHIQPIASIQYMGQIGYVHNFKGKKKK
jgi:hypothetical protein